MRKETKKKINHANELIANGENIVSACKKANISYPAYNKFKKEVPKIKNNGLFMVPDETKELKERVAKLTAENIELRSLLKKLL